MLNETGVKRYPFLEKICAIILSLFIFLSISSLEAKVVRGIVIDNATEKPVTGSVVMLFVGKTIYAGAITDSTGLFSFSNFDIDRFYIRAKRIGYSDLFAGPLIIPVKDTLTLILKMVPQELLMSEIVVEEKKTDKWLEREGYNRRKEMGMGHYLKVDEIKGRSFSNVTQILRSLPGIIIQQKTVNIKNGDFGPEIYSYRNPGLRGQQVSVYIDGMQLNDNGSIDNFSPGDIAAVEFYASDTTAPSEYHGAGGVLLIWTKR